MRNLVLISLGVFILNTIYHSAIAQPVNRQGQTGIKQSIQIDETTTLFDKTTSKKITYREYQQLIKDDVYAYYPEPIYNEYGDVSAYAIRPTTAEERATHSFSGVDVTLRPKVGEPMPLFVMKGVDNKLYRSTDLTGQVVILSFWISMKKPFWGTDQAKRLADILKHYPSQTDPVSLGILQDSKEDIEAKMASETLPFVPIPTSYGFHKKFHVSGSPSFIVIDRAGKVAAFIDGADYAQLQKVVSEASR